MVKVQRTRTVVHFGAGDFIPGEHGPPVHKYEFHVVYDPDKRLIREYKKRADKLRPGRVLFKYYLRVPFLHPKSGAKTKSKSGEVDAVHMHNVLSIQSAENREALMREAARILRRKGKIYVSEIYVSRMFAPSELRKLAAGFGLRVKFIIHNTRMSERKWRDEEKKVLRKIMGLQGTAHDAFPGVYLAQLTKL